MTHCPRGVEKWIPLSPAYTDDDIQGELRIETTVFVKVSTDIPLYIQQTLYGCQNRHMRSIDFFELFQGDVTKVKVKIVEAR